MTNRERENRTLDFIPFPGRGCVEETFYPWDITVEAFINQGLSKNACSRISYIRGQNFREIRRDKFLMVLNSMDYEKEFGFDPLLRLQLFLPVRWDCQRVIGKPYVETMDDWNKMLDYSNKIEHDFFNNKDFEEVYSKFVKGHQNGDYPVRINVEGFMFAPREIVGIEKQLYAFYDDPELLHAINEYILKFYLKYLIRLLKILPADVLYISEDLSGKNGPMISPAIFEEYIGDYYRPLFPALREAGANYIFVDTDGDFNMLIPNFIKAGVDGFLPLDVNAGMDINKVRRHYPTLRLIGGFNKLEIANGREAIDSEFKRILPVIRQGGFIPGCDHQVPPHVPIEYYKYYVRKLTEVMQQAGVEASS